MSTLHILNNIDANRWQACQLTLQPQDTLLLIEEGVYHWPALQTQLDPDIQLICLAEDAALRGIMATSTLDYGEWVELALKHSRCISW